MNVIFVCMDSLRQDHVGAYGNDWIHTPHLDAFTSESCKFTQSYPEGFNTIPVRTSWLTGRYTFMYRPWMPLHMGDRTVAEAVTWKGYKAAVIGDCYQVHKKQYAMYRGFEYMEMIRGQEFDQWIVDESIPVDCEKYFKPNPHEPKKSEVWKKLLAQYLRNVSGRKTEEDYFPARVTKAVCDYLERQDRLDNHLLWVEYFDPHEPWDPPQKYRDLYEKDYQGQDIIDAVGGKTEGYLTDEELAHCRALYAGEVSLVDHWVGVLYEKIKELGMLENTMIIYTSDHGHPLGHQGYMKKAFNLLHNELVKTPFMVRMPDGTGAGQTCDAVIQSPDLMPTMLDFLGLESFNTVQGESILPLIRGEKEKIRDYAYCGHHKASWAIKNADWSLLLYLKEVFGHNDPELFNVRADPDEQHNIIDQHPDVARDLEIELRRFVHEMEQQPMGSDGLTPGRWGGSR